MRKALADMHVPPVWRRWIARGGLALAVATLLANADRLWSTDSRLDLLRGQIRAATSELASLRSSNASLRRQIDAVQRQPAAIEAVAREELGLVFPDELVMRLPSESDR